MGNQGWICAVYVFMHGYESKKAKFFISEEKTGMLFVFALFSFEMST